ncbi:peptide ABC transporter ATP-binding protein [Halobacteriales archaeon QS_1_67_19]|nr:MAG: peptide ABC transporter ATP-binding protein [Halobacteriales archaeon QS_1_67_19]
MSDSEDPLLSVRNLTKHYPVTSGLLRRTTGQIRAVDGIDLDVGRGEAVGVVGESGCGKSTAARTILGLESPTDGEVVFDGRDATDFSRAERKRFRRRAQIVFQDPTSSFDPRMTIGESIAEPMVAHGLGEERRASRTESLLKVVDLPTDTGDRYPHELSGGQKQRAALARALSLDPDLLVLDEPVSALDVSVQAEVLELIADLRDRFDLTILLISHDLSVVRQICDRVAVMYLGEIVERAPTAALFDDPKHPYTEGLLASIPAPDPHERFDTGGLSGNVPDPSAPPAGCRFHTRCPAVISPDDLDVPRTVWRALFRLRVDLRDGAFGIESMRERLAEAGDEEPTPAELRRCVRAEYDLPDRLPDADAEPTLSAALEDAVAGRLDRAAGRLREAFPTVCVRRTPELRETDDRAVACHLHDADAEPTDRDVQ